MLFSVNPFIYEMSGNIVITHLKGIFTSLVLKSISSNPEDSVFSLEKLPKPIIFLSRIFKHTSIIFGGP